MTSEHVENSYLLEKRQEDTIHPSPIKFITITGRRCSFLCCQGHEDKMGLGLFIAVNVYSLSGERRLKNT